MYRSVSQISTSLLLVFLFPNPSECLASNVPLQIDHEYALEFQDGTTIKNARLLRLSQTTCVIKIKGLTEPITVDRGTIKAWASAEKPAAAPRSKYEIHGIAKWEVIANAGLNFTLGELRNLDTSFAAFSMGSVRRLSNPVRIIPWRSLQADITYARLSDSDRRMDMFTLIVMPRFEKNLGGLVLFAGIGGGISLLNLRSYSFARWGYSATIRATSGMSFAMTNRFNVIATCHLQYWQDNLETLLSAGGGIGIGYMF